MSQCTTETNMKYDILVKPTNPTQPNPSTMYRLSFHSGWEIADTATAFVVTSQFTV